jgi:hypothetical protein
VDRRLAAAGRQARLRRGYRDAVQHGQHGELEQILRRFTRGGPTVPSGGT